MKSLSVMLLVSMFFLSGCIETIEQAMGLVRERYHQEATLVKCLKYCELEGLRLTLLIKTPNRDVKPEVCEYYRVKIDRKDSKLVAEKKLLADIIDNCYIDDVMIENQRLKDKIIVLDNIIENSGVAYCEN